MAVSWMPLTPDARALLATSILDSAPDDGLSAFPSERDWAIARRPGARPVSGVTMRVAKISTPTALLLAVILALGAGSAVAIGIIAGTPAMTTSSMSQARR